MAARRRLDAELVRRDLAPSRDAAKRLIEEGRVLVGGAPATKASRQVDPAEDVKVQGDPPRFVSRAGEKLAAALEFFGVDATGRYCIDIGSSTGGFTDCLLQNGARHVVAVDVGTHQLHERLRDHPQVQVREQTDIRSVKLGQFPNGLSLAVGDVSFISLKLVFPVVVDLNVEDALLLIKPQFEAGRQEVSRGNGVIADPMIWRRVLDDVLSDAAGLGLGCRGLMISPITGRAGNVEFVAHLAPGAASDSLAEMIEAVVPDPGLLESEPSDADKGSEDL